MNVYIIIASVGRCALLRRTVDRIARQTRRPDGVIVVGAATSDVDGVDRCAVPADVVLGPRGLCAQRNRGLDQLAGRADVVLFIDDDFLMADDYLQGLEALFAQRQELVGLTGRVVADGVRGPGLSFEHGENLLSRLQPPAATEEPREALYGCNMAVRVAAIDGLRFDEELPLYGWQEDIDFTYRLGRRGTMIRSGLLRGVHLGVKAGRTSGLRLGYSQVANVVYLLRKRSMPPALGRRLLYRNLASNVFKSIWPEPHVDRRGRLRGNVLALRDVLLGTAHPKRILDL
jgi:glycosyltransferase involved in cell wall biosynthesis